MEGSASYRQWLRLVLIALLLAATLTTVPSLVFAAGNYGAGAYGGGAYGQGEVSAPSGGGGGSGSVIAIQINPMLISTSTTVNIPAVQAVILPPSTGSTAPFQFAYSLQFRDRHPDVKRLQKYLNAHGALVAAEGAGSPGRETDYFGGLTYRALVRFQEAHADAILRPLRLTAGTGFFGAATRAFVNGAPVD